MCVAIAKREFAAICNQYRYIWIVCQSPIYNGEITMFYRICLSPRRLYFCREYADTSL